jgi:glutathione S-transferase
LKGGPDPLVNAKADSLSQYVLNDLFMKIAKNIFASGENRDAELKAAAKEWVPKMYPKFVEFLPADKKYLTGDTLTIYDFQAIHIIINLITNPQSKDPAMWASIWEMAPERVKKYHADFSEEMKAYLDARPKTCTV